MLASFPASMLNQKRPDLGILNRFKLDPSRSSTKRAADLSLRHYLLNLYRRPSTYFNEARGPHPPLLH
jgi:hypothetical protein